MTKRKCPGKKNRGKNYQINKSSDRGFCGIEYHKVHVHRIANL